MFVILACAATPLPWLVALALCIAVGALLAPFYSEPLNRALRAAAPQVPAVWN